MLRQKKIAIDFDEVLCPMIPHLNKHFERIYKRRSPKSMPSTYNYAKYYGISDIESKKLVHSFYYSTIAYETKPIKDAVSAIKALKNKGHELSIVTGRQSYPQCKKVTHYLLEKYWYNCFDNVIFTNSYSLNGESISKSDVLKKLDADIFIDDSLENYNECKTLFTTECIVFGNYDWNISNDEIHRENSWNGVLDYIQ